MYIGKFATLLFYLQRNLVKSINHTVVCLLLSNAHKMSTRQAALDEYTESEPFRLHFSKVNKLPYDGTTLVGKLQK